MKSALDRRLGIRVPSGWCVIPWLAEHAGNILTLLEVGEDGKTPLQRLRGWKLKAQLVEFGERVHFWTVYYAKQCKLDSKWKEYFDLGKKLESSDTLVGTDEGVFKCRSVRRRPDE